MREVTVKQNIFGFDLMLGKDTILNLNFKENAELIAKILAKDLEYKKSDYGSLITALDEYISLLKTSDDYFGRDIKELESLQDKFSSKWSYVRSRYYDIDRRCIKIEASNNIDDTAFKVIAEVFEGCVSYKDNDAETDFYAQRIIKEAQKKIVEITNSVGSK